MTLLSSTIGAWAGLVAVALSFSVSSSATGLQPDASVPVAPGGEPPALAPEPATRSNTDKPMPPLRFDLICDVSQRIVNNPPEGRRGLGTTPPGGWDFDEQFRYLIDLNAMRYCRADTCAEFGRRKIASWDADRIVLNDRTHGDSWTFFIVNRHEATLEERATRDDGFMRRRTGFCRYEPFSGFPTDRDPHGHNS